MIFTKCLLLLLHGRSVIAQTTISKDYDLETLHGRSKINGIWKLKLEAYEKVKFKVYTYHKDNFIETECQEFIAKMYVIFVVTCFLIFK